MPGSAFKTILAPVDLSNRSRAVLQYACRLAAPLGARVDVLFVEPETPVTAHHSDVPASERTEAARAALRRFVNDVADTRRVVLEERVEMGNPRERIVQRAIEASADIIVIGTHARTGRSRSLAGSVAESIVRTAPCPVITLRTPD